jgi:hypothetical protein
VKSPIPADTLLAEELACDEIVLVANLTTTQTGAPGAILFQLQWVGMDHVLRTFAARTIAAQLFGCNF